MTRYETEMTFRVVSANDAIALIAKGRDILEALYADRDAEEHPLRDIAEDLGEILARIEKVVGL